MEDTLLMPKRRAEVFDTIKEALTISSNNRNFIIFTFFTSLPLLCFLIFYETVLQQTLFSVSDTLPSYDQTARFPKEFCQQLIQLGFLYLVPLHLLELFTVIVTVDLASEIYRDKPMTLKEIINKPISMTTMVRTFKTSIYVLFLSTSTLLGFIWLVSTYSFLLRNSSYDVFFAVLVGGVFIALLKKYLELSAWWNMSIVISILEEISGAEAFAVSACFIRGSERQGLLLMLVFFLWGLCLRFPCLVVGCEEMGIGLVVQIFLLGVGNVIKWVVCMVYFYECKRSVLEKKVNVEVGREVEAVDSSEVVNSLK